MKISSLRASSINSWEDCQWRFYLQNVLGLESVPGKKALLGTSLHWIAEILARAKKNGHYKLGGKLIDPQVLTKVSWDHHNKLYPGLFDEKADFKTLQKMVNVLWNAEYNPLNSDILDVEKQFDIELNIKGFKGSDDKPIRLRGTMDQIEILDKDTIRISDFKTGQRKAWNGGYLYDESNLKENIQFVVYDTARRIIYPEYKYCILRMIYLMNGGSYSITYEDHELPANLETIRRALAEIKSCEMPNRLIDDKNRKDEHFKCRYVCNHGSRTDMWESDCHKFYKLHQQGKDDQIIEMTNNGRPLSPRNDYSGSKIFKGVFTL